MYFPDVFGGNAMYNSALLKDAKADLESIFFGKDTSTQKEEAEAEILRLSQPKLWNVYMKGNEEQAMENGFEQFMFLVGEHTKEDLNNISVFRFYSLLEYIKSKENGRV